MGLDKVFVINLVRRKERLNRMLYCLNELGLNATVIEATDGRLVTGLRNKLNIDIGFFFKCTEQTQFIKE